MALAASRRLNRPVLRGPGLSRADASACDRSVPCRALRSLVPSIGARRVPPVIVTSIVVSLLLIASPEEWEPSWTRVGPELNDRTTCESGARPSVSLNGAPPRRFVAGKRETITRRPRTRSIADGAVTRAEIGRDDEGRLNMGNTRSASYSYGAEQRRAAPYRAPGDAYHSQYWDGPGTSDSGSCSSAGGRDEAPEASPVPFVRHRNAPIRLPRINSAKDCWQGSLGHLRRPRRDGLSCSTPGVSLPPERTVPVEAERHFVRGAVSCASLDGRGPFRRLGFATRSYQQPRRPAARPVRPSSSLTLLAGPQSNVRDYLETARLKKRSVELCLRHKSWVSISQGSLDDDEADGFAETLKAASVSSGASYLTLVTARTSLSSGYHGPASSGAATDDDRDAGQASGAFYLDRLRHVSGSLPGYVELRQGRLRLKLTQGQSCAC